jgi:hypothetical protein
MGGASEWPFFVAAITTWCTVQCIVRNLLVVIEVRLLRKYMNHEAIFDWVIGLFQPRE